MFGICFLFNCILMVSFPSPCTDGDIWVCGSVCGDGEARQCHGQGTAARARVGSPTPDFLPAWWLLRTVLCFSLLCSHTSPPHHPDGNTPVHPVPESSCCPRAGMSHRLPAGWCRVAEGQDGGPSPIKGDIGRGCWEMGLPSIPALPHP